MGPQPAPYGYAWTSTARARLTTSPTELRDIAIAYVVLTIDLLILYSGSTVLLGGAATGLFTSASPILIVVSATAAFTGFVAHEMAHKITAQRRGFWAEFRMSPMGLAISFVSAFIGILWAAPGATVVGGIAPYDLRNWGVTSLAGPLTNIGFATVFYVGAIGLFLAGSGFFVWLLFLAFINTWFGTFNLLPFGPLDGAKVRRWDSSLWLDVFVVSAGLTAICALALFVYGSPFLAW